MIRIPDEEETKIWIAVERKHVVTTADNKAQNFQYPSNICSYLHILNVAKVVLALQYSEQRHAKLIIFFENLMMINLDLFG